MWLSRLQRIGDDDVHRHGTLAGARYTSRVSQSRTAYLRRLLTARMASRDKLRHGWLSTCRKLYKIATKFSRMINVACRQSTDSERWEDEHSDDTWFTTLSKLQPVIMYKKLRPAKTWLQPQTAHDTHSFRHSTTTWWTDGQTETLHQYRALYCRAICKRHLIKLQLFREVVLCISFAFLPVIFIR